MTSRTSEIPPMRLPRPRLTTRRMMIVMTALAAPLGAWATWMRAAEPKSRSDDPGPAPDPTPPVPREAVAIRPDGPIVDASLIRLIADPDRHDGKLVRVEGFLHVEFEGTALYLSRDDANHLITRNGLWISFGRDLAGGNLKGVGPQEFNRKFVLIEGVFDKKLLGHMGLWSGGIREVWRVMEATKFYND